MSTRQSTIASETTIDANKFTITITNDEEDENWHTIIYISKSKIGSM